MTIKLKHKLVLVKAATTDHTSTLSVLSLSSTSLLVRCPVRL